MPKNKLFDLEYQYQLYLQRMRLSEATMHREQKIQLKQTFFGAAGQILLLLRDDIGALPDEEAVDVLDSLIIQVGKYCVKEVEQHKARNQ